MSTTPSHSLNKDMPAGMASISINPRDYWDDTNKRPKSGYFAVNITGLAISYTGGGSELVNVKFIIPNAGDGTFTKHSFQQTISSSPASVNKTYNVAWNYGTPGPGARINADGTVSLVDVVVDLDSADGTACTAFVLTVTYTLTFTEISPYSTLSSPTNITHTVASVAGSNKSLGCIPVLSTGSSYMVLQLKSMTSTVSRFPKGTSKFDVALAGNPSLKLLSTGLAAIPTSVVNYKDNYKLVCAINDSKYDANVATVNNAGTTSKAALVTSLNSNGDGGTSVALNYDIKEG